MQQYTTLFNRINYIRVSFSMKKMSFLMSIRKTTILRIDKHRNEIAHALLCKPLLLFLIFNEDHRMCRTKRRFQHIHAQSIIIIVYKNDLSGIDTGEKFIYLLDDYLRFFLCFKSVKTMRHGDSVKAFNHIGFPVFMSVRFP